MRFLFRVGVFVLAGSTVVQADSDLSFSPAISAYPAIEIDQFRACVANGKARSRGASAVEHVTAWFQEFRRPVFVNSARSTREPIERGESSSYARVRGAERLARQLADYRTEQALVAMVDAAVRHSGPKLGCIEVISALAVRIAEQRDRAWTWASRVDRRLQILDQWYQATNTLDRLRYSAFLVKESRQKLDRFKD